MNSWNMNTWNVSTWNVSTWNVKGLLALSVLLSSMQALALTGTEVMNQNEDHRKIDEVHSAATLITGGGGGPERTKQFTWWKKLAEDKVHFNTLTRFQLPCGNQGRRDSFSRTPGRSE